MLSVISGLLRSSQATLIRTSRLYSRRWIVMSCNNRRLAFPNRSIHCAALKKKFFFSINSKRENLRRKIYINLIIITTNPEMFAVECFNFDSLKITLHDQTLTKMFYTILNEIMFMTIITITITINKRFRYKTTVINCFNSNACLLFESR